MAAELPVAAVPVEESDPGDPAPAPATEVPGSGKALQRFRPDSTVQWVGVLGFLLLLLRGACRR